MDDSGETAQAPNGWPAALLAGFRRGDRAALAEVYRQHAPEVAAFLRAGFTFTASERWIRFGGFESAFDLQDALHETFRRAFEPGARLGYDGLREYAPYLLTIARNVVLRTFRLRENLFSTPGELEGGPYAEPVMAEAPPSPEARLLTEQARALVRAFLDRQTDVDRQLLSLRFVEGLSQRDVADRLGIGRQRIRTREAALRSKLLTFIRDNEAAPRGAGPLVVGLAATLVKSALLGWLR
jgi:RNA polymerase sigma-70 factor (ECF subfamily)